ncbi:MAG: transcription antitermination factor NusB [Balneolaceae bacterium]
MINRREVREVVLQALYALEVGGNPPADIRKYILNAKLSNDREALEFAEKLFLRTIDMEEELDKIISEQIKNWKINRLAFVDKILLRIALCEFLRFEDIPSKVTINEAIELAKDYSTGKSGKFVNGILDAALGKLNKEGRIRKTGRGLMESPRK